MVNMEVVLQIPDTYVIPGIIKWGGRMKYRLLRKVEHLGHVQRHLGRTFYTRFHFLKDLWSLPAYTSTFWNQLALKSFMIGIISISNASFVTSPPRKSILFPTSITGTCDGVEKILKSEGFSATNRDCSHLHQARESKVANMLVFDQRSSGCQ